MSPAEPFPVVRIGHLPEPQAAPTWLISSLWAQGGVGILGGQPKCAKTWLALDMALSVASGSACLDRFPVPEKGPVLVYLAEDSAYRAQERIAGLCRHRQLELKALDLLLLESPQLRLDQRHDLDRLTATVEQIRPCFLVLDPLVRLHRCNENHAGEISSLLADLRALQRQHQLAILLVHHARKNGSGTAGQNLRGSGDLWAWGDSNAYLSRRGELLALTLEHRYQPAIDPFHLKLTSRPDGSLTHLELTQPIVEPQITLEEQILEILRHHAPLTRTALRDRLRVNNQRLGYALDRLDSSGRIKRQHNGWQIDCTKGSFRSEP